MENERDLQIRHPQEDQARLNRLLRVFFGLSTLLLLGLLVPYFAGRIQYSLTAAKERAEADVAREQGRDFQLDQQVQAYTMLPQVVRPSVVSIRTNRRTRMGNGQGQGSGVIIDKQGYILTNEHVVRGVDTVDIELSDGRSGSGSVVGLDPDLDLAVIKTELDDLTPAAWGNSEDLEVGEPVWAFGSPFGLKQTVTSGIVSAKKRRGITRGPYNEFLQTDAAVNPGNSGGPLVNSRAEVVGINNMIFGEGFQGISFAIPSELAKDTYEKLRRDGYVERGFLGVMPTKVPDQLAEELGIDRGQGVMVNTLTANTPAHDAGFRRGDVILTWNGQPYNDPTLLSRAIAATPIGQKVPVEVLRNDNGGASERTLEVTVGARPRR